MEMLENPFRGRGLLPEVLPDVPYPSTDAETPSELIARCPKAQETPLHQDANMARRLGVADVWIKDESTRMGLGAFKALGAAYVIAREAQRGDVSGTTYVTASAGNHGLSVAAGASAFGAASVVFLAKTVPSVFAERLRSQGARVVIAGEDYAQSLTAAQEFAATRGFELLPDATGDWPDARPHLVMEGYTVLMAEVEKQISAPPSHIFLQAGVGGLAGAAAARARATWGDAPQIVVVEPEVGRPLWASIKAGRPVEIPGPESCMGRLDCKEPSTIALKGLARDADFFTLISEETALEGTAEVARMGYASTPSGAAGLVALLQSQAHRDKLHLDAGSQVLCILSEGPEILERPEAKQHHDEPHFAQR